MLEGAKVMVGKSEACRKVGEMASLDSFCVLRRQRCVGRDEETGFESKLEIDEGKDARLRQIT